MFPSQYKINTMFESLGEESFNRKEEKEEKIKLFSIPCLWVEKNGRENTIF